MKFIAKLISYMLHPVLIPLITTGCYFLFTESFHQEIIVKYTFIQVTVMTIILPTFLYLILKSFKVIKSSIMVNDLEERKIPFFFNILLLSILIFRFWEFEGNPDLKLFFKGYLISYIILFICVFLKQKISVHVCAFTSTLPFTIFTAKAFYEPLTWQTCVLIFTLGLLSTSRLYLKSHTNTEVILGFFIGISSQILAYKI